MKTFNLRKARVRRSEGMGGTKLRRCGFEG